MLGSINLLQLIQFKFILISYWIHVTFSVTLYNTVPLVNSYCFKWDISRIQKTVLLVDCLIIILRKLIYTILVWLLSIYLRLDYIDLAIWEWIPFLCVTHWHDCIWSISFGIILNSIGFICHKTCGSRKGHILLFFPAKTTWVFA